MAVTREILDFFMRSIGPVRPGARMLELGDQLMDDPSVPEATAKGLFTRLGFEHVSLDLNGLNGALPVDLSAPTADPSLVGQFDVVTNSGTLEHVEPFESQYAAFSNVHAWLKPGGLALHVIPDIGSLERSGANEGHCNNYYSRPFFEALARLALYDLVSCEVSSTGNWHACLRKVGDPPFSFPPEELLQHVARKSGGLVYPGINDV